mmetsp:Transcript_20848/g.52167  ORF Transcript_20848/g.52167 Transcript_20848/m.52167 type:complete len:212 (-) Transcript_20848:527-1162(-)
MTNGLCSRVVRVDKGLVGRVWIKFLLDESFGLVDQASHLHHLGLDGVADVGGLGFEVVVGALAEDILELVRLNFDALIRRLALASECGHGSIGGHVLSASREDAGLNHTDQGVDLDAERRYVVLIHDFSTRIAFLFREDAELFEQGLRFLRVELRHGLRRVLQIWKPALRRLRQPLLGVAVAREDDVAVLLEHLRHGVSVAHASLDQRGEG